MSLDVYLEVAQPVDDYGDYSAYHANITHNLTEMAEAAGVYDALWNPEEIPTVLCAKDLVPLLEAGLAKLKKNPARFKKLNPPNGWGNYEGLVNFVTNYLAACKDTPEATVRVSK